MTGARPARDGGEFVTIQECRDEQAKVYAYAVPRWVACIAGALFLSGLATTFWLAQGADTSERIAQGVIQVELQHIRTSMEKLELRLDEQERLLVSIDKRVNHTAPTTAPGANP